MKKKYQKDNVLYYKKEKNHVQDLILPGETHGNESKFLTENVDIFFHSKITRGHLTQFFNMFAVHLCHLQCKIPLIDFEFLALC